ncbi:MAG: site-specific integrase, partial [Cyanobacteriota bacterium]|nr:site-specific integrase [Cyanobacteriota bacterium]
MSSADLAALVRLVAVMPKAEVLALVARLCDAAATAALWSDDELTERFLQQCSPTASRETHAAYGRELRHLSRWINAHHPGTPLRALTPAMAQHCLGDLRAQVAEGTLKRRSYNRRLACWSGFWQWASDPGRAEHTGIDRTIWPRRAFYPTQSVPQALPEPELTAVLG